MIMFELPDERTTDEYCPHCDSEVEISAIEPDECPNCGVVILPCSTCFDEDGRSLKCDWTEEKRCWRFPK